LNSENSEAQILKLSQGILHARSLNSSELTAINFFNKYIQNQISTPVIREFIANNRNSLIFTGELLI